MASTSTISAVFRYSESLGRILDRLNKCARAPSKVRAGRLAVQIGRTPDGYSDVVGCRGDGVAASDARLVIAALAEARISPAGEVAPCLIEELAHRGYDLSTLRFRIDKKEVAL